MLGKTTLVLLLPVLLATIPQQRQREASLSLIARDYESAVALLSRELADLESDPEQARKKKADRILFLLAGARLQSGNLPGAAARLAEPIPEEREFVMSQVAALVNERQRGEIDA